MTNNNYIHVYFIALVDGLQLCIETISYEMLPFWTHHFCIFSLCLSLWLKDECLINYLTGFYFGIPVIL